MSNLAEHSMMNNFVDSIDEAIKYVGGDTSKVQCLYDYPQIIKEQLIAGFGGDFSLVEGSGIKITKDGTQYIISANSDAILNSSLLYKDVIIPQGSSIQKTFETIFESILPIIPSIISGSIITTDDEGSNQYQHPNYDPEIIRIKKGLNPNTKYLRIFIASQEEPIYISMEELGVNFVDAPSDGNIYGRKNNEWVKIENGGVTTSPLSPPHPKSEDIPEGTPFQKVFEKLFDEILPAMPSIIKGDIILSTEEGTDQYQHPNYQIVKIKSGLDPNNYYIRIFIASQEEPIYISAEPLKGNEGKIYDGSVGENIDIMVDNTRNIISATLKNIPQDIIEESVNNIISKNSMDEASVNDVFNEIFN